MPSGCRGAHRHHHQPQCGPERRHLQRDARGVPHGGQAYPSIYKTQDTVDYIAKKDAELSIQGRHDPCIVPRAAIVQTCAAALAVGDLLTAKYGMAWMEDPTGYRKEVL